MRSLKLLFVLTLMPAFAYTVHYNPGCAELLEGWFDDQGMSWYLEVEGSTVGGRVSAEDTCEYRDWPVSGTYTSSSSYLYLTATNPSYDDDCIAYFSWFGTIDEGGCDTGSGTYITSEWLEGPWSWVSSRGCSSPEDEYSYWIDQGYGEWATAGMFAAYLQGGDFWGRTVYEMQGLDDGDSCHFNGSALNEYYTFVSGGEWSVDSSSAYGIDLIGWNTTAVEYIRYWHALLELPMPCDSYAIQRMKIVCNSEADMLYKTNVIGTTVYPSSYTTIWRDGIGSTVIWP